MSESAPEGPRESQSVPHSTQKLTLPLHLPQSTIGGAVSAPRIDDLRPRRISKGPPYAQNSDFAESYSLQAPPSHSQWYPQHPRPLRSTRQPRPKHAKNRSLCSISAIWRLSSSRSSSSSERVSGGGSPESARGKGTFVGHAGPASAGRGGEWGEKIVKSRSAGLPSGGPWRLME